GHHAGQGRQPQPVRRTGRRHGAVDGRQPAVSLAATPFRDDAASGRRRCFRSPCMSRRTVPLLTLIAPLALAACTPPGPAPLDTVVAGDAGPVTVARIQGSGERSPLEGRQVEFEAVVV